ncbi:MAG: hypothetical protein K6F78_03570, partial [Bacteroidaceae bacterium]|nr:hypothetical protein [Bacteroidaceae bacterium]
SVTFSKIGTVVDGNITILYQNLIREKWIDKNTNPDDFLAIFSGTNSTKTIKWLKAKGVLYNLFKKMIEEKLITYPDGQSLMKIISSHFTDKDGKYLTNLNSSYINGKKNKIDIDNMITLLKLTADDISDYYAKSSAN